MPKRTTLEELARMVQKGFEATATKDDLRKTEQRIARHIDGLELKISAYASSWQQDFERLQTWVKELDTRLHAVESKPRR